jgi:hypothetical protein
VGTAVSLLDPPATPRAVEKIPCAAPVPLLRRVQRGYVPGRSGDVLAIERLPHQFGTRHSGPYPYTQDVPLMLYGPGYIRAGIRPHRPITVADLAPTYAELMGFSAFPERDGRVLKEALLPATARPRPPRLIITVVWDGGGWNVLRRWPGAWPELKRIGGRGTTYQRATVGSSPSITPAVHATIGTGSFPDTHGVSEVMLRINGRIVDSWQGSSPKFLEIPTLADLWDDASDDAALVGLLARDEWHLGMMGHGSFLPRGDKDIAVLDDIESNDFRAVPPFFRFPGFMNDRPSLAKALSLVDNRDGQQDGSWLENQILMMNEDVRYTPAWSIYQTQRIQALLRRLRFGKDSITDLFFTNYKGTDLAGHRWNMIEPEVRDNLREQDRQLLVLVKGLDSLVGERRYVLALTADHGMTPSSTETEGWSVDLEEMTLDLERSFDGIENGRGVVSKNRGYQIFLDHEELERNRLTPADIARFVRDYRVEDNAPDGNVIAGDFAGSSSSRLFLTALTPAQLPEAIACAKREGL